MKKSLFVIVALALAMLIPRSAAAKGKKKPPRGMIESMQSVSCGMKEKGLNGLGAVWASVGVTSVSSNEKLCPQYLFEPTNSSTTYDRPTPSIPSSYPLAGKQNLKSRRIRFF